MKFNAISCVGLFCCRGVQIAELVFARALLAENPQSLAGDSVIFRRMRFPSRKTNTVLTAGSLADKVAPELARARSSL